jgi:3-hydroxyisobutyrate dehydrogenase-like beta-hydroxyacid dehydrogenase
MPQVAVLGTGVLGSAFVEGLVARGGTRVAVWNRTRAHAEPLAALGVMVCETPAEAVQGAARVHLVLLDDDAVDAVVDALRPGLAPGAVIVDHSTTAPARTAARAAALAAAGVPYLHAPVLMGPGAARSAKGMMLVAGPVAHVERVRSGLAEMTGELWFVGERPDLAACHKLAANAMVLGTVGLMADVFALMEGHGVDRQETMAMLSRVNLTSAVAFRGPMMAARRYAPAQFALAVARKDVGFMLEGGEPGAPVTAPMLAALAAHLDAAVARGAGALDVAALGD